MNIEHKLDPVEHWIVDGKAYRMATEKDVGKEVYLSDSVDGFRHAISSGKVPLTAYEPGSEKPYICRCRWKFAFIQDDSLLPRKPAPGLPDGWFLLRDDEVLQDGDKFDTTGDDTAWVDATRVLGMTLHKAFAIYKNRRAARYFGTKHPESAPTKPIDWTKPVRTKSTKKPVRIVCTDGPGEYSVIGILDGEVDFWDLGGNLQDDPDNNWCLENAPQRIQREYWVNVYDDPHVSLLHETKKDAEARRSHMHKCLACVKITIDCGEGEGL